MIKLIDWFIEPLGYTTICKKELQCLHDKAGTYHKDIMPSGEIRSLLGDPDSFDFEIEGTIKYSAGNVVDFKA